MRKLIFAILILTSIMMEAKVRKPAVAGPIVPIIIATLLMMTEKNPFIHPHHIMYQNSGDSPYGGKDRVVGYHSFVFTQDEDKQDAAATDDTAGFSSCPLHFSRFFPRYKMLDSSPTPKETLYLAERIAKEEGMERVYLGNL